MIQTIVVYTVLTIVMSKLTIVRHKKAILGLSIFSWLGILLFALIFGIRYDVGRDYISYLNNFEHAVIYGDVIRPMELGFDLITIFFADRNFHFSFYFGFIALLQFFLLNYSFKDDDRLRFCVIISFMITCSFLSWMNGLRQIIALSIFIYSINFVINRQIFKYIITIIIASLFHTSALILLPVYFILINPTKLIIPVKYQIFIFLISIIISGRYNDQIFQLFPKVISDLGYSHYEEYVSNEITLGLGYFITIILNLFIMINYPNISKSASIKFNYFYLLFLIGVIWQQLFLGSIPLARPNYYFYGVNFIVYAYYLNEYLRNLTKKNLTNLLILIVLFVMIFLGYLVNQDDNTFKYNFFWDI